MTDIPNRPPLWKALKAADASWTSDLTIPEARAIKAMRDWLVPEKPHPGEGEFWPDADTEREWQYNHRLRALLTTEADRAEMGDHA